MTKADIVKGAKKVDNFPIIEGFQGELKEFQKVGVLWLYLVKNGLLADSCGLGKTIQILALLQLLRNRNELRRTLILVPSPAVEQWKSEITRFVPALRVISPSHKVYGERCCVYSAAFEIMLSHYALFIREFKIYQDLGFEILIADEGSMFRNHDTLTAHCVKDLAETCSRRIVLSATPIQNTLMDIHSIYQVIDNRILGGYHWFRERYCNIGKTYTYARGKRYLKEIITGYKRISEVKERLAPNYLRKTIKEVEEELPDLTVDNKWLELHKQQRTAYTKLRKDTLALSEIVKIRRNIHSLQQLLDGLQSVNSQLADVSVKLDKIMELLQGDLCQEKVVIFSRYKATIRTFADRMVRAGKERSFVVITGDESSSEKDLAFRKFWDVPECQVCIGTVALELSLNLQCAQYMIAIDQLYNPARIEQLVGRIRRLGSRHHSIVLMNLLIRDSLEERIINLVKTKQVLIDKIFDEQSELFGDLSASEMFMVLKD